MEEYTRTAGNPAQSYCFKEMRHCPACGNHGNCTLTACTYHQPSDEGRFPDEAEREYRKNFEAKCKKTGVNIIAEPDADVAEAIEQIEMLSKAIENDMHWRSDKLMKSLETAIAALQAYQPWIPVSERLPKNSEHDWVLVQITEDNGYMWIPKVVEYRERIGDWYCEELGWLKTHNGTFKVTHWKPLPEPPKGETT